MRKTQSSAQQGRKWAVYFKQMQEFFSSIVIWDLLHLEYLQKITIDDNLLHIMHNSVNEMKFVVK